MQITEPVTMLTDYALAAASLYFAFLLARILGPRNRVFAWLWCAAFIASSVAALLGGIYDGFALHFDACALQVMYPARSLPSTDALMVSLSQFVVLFALR